MKTRNRFANRRENDANPQQLQLVSTNWMRGFVARELTVRAIAAPDARDGFQILGWVNISCTFVYIIGVVFSCFGLAVQSPMIAPAVNFITELASNLILPFGSRGTWLLNKLFGVLQYPISLLLKFLLYLVIFAVPYCQFAMSLSYALEGVSDEIAILYNDDVMHNFWNRANLWRKFRVCCGIVASSFIFIVRYNIITLVYGFCEYIMYGFCAWHVAAAAVFFLTELLLKIDVGVDWLCSRLTVQLDELEKQSGVTLGFSTFPMLVGFSCRIVTSFCLFVLLALGLPFCLVPHFALGWVVSGLTIAARYSGMLKLSYWQQTSLVPTSSHLLTCVYYPVGYWETNASLLYNRLVSHVRHFTLPASADVTAYMQGLVTRFANAYRVLVAYQKHAHNQGVRTVAAQGANLHLQANTLVLPVAEATWPCRRCAYFNPDESAACVICRTARRRTVHHEPPALLMEPHAQDVDAQLQHALQVITDEEYAEQLMAEQVAAAAQENDWVDDRFSGAMFAAIFDNLVADAEAFQAEETADANALQAAQVIADNVAERAQVGQQDEQPPLERIGGHGQNVHHAAIEGPALTMIAELFARPLPAGMSKASMLAELAHAFANWRAPAIDSAQERATTQRVIASARDVITSTAQMETSSNGYRFDDTLVAVWTIVRARGDDKIEMIRRLAEEIAEGVGMCAGGRVGRLVNAVRGFVDVGIHIVHERESLMDEFARLVLRPPELSVEQRRAVAEIVLDAHGVNGAARAGWLDSLAEL